MKIKLSNKLIVDTDDKLFTYRSDVDRLTEALIDFKDKQIANKVNFSETYKLYIDNGFKVKATNYKFKSLLFWRNRDYTAFTNDRIALIYSYYFI